MIADLKPTASTSSLWQLPYFAPKNALFPEILVKGLAVRDGKGNLPYEDAILDFSNPATVQWYQDKLAGLLKMGVGAIKVDFGEAAPLTGVYATGRSGLYEHNLYPLRYNKAVADITRQDHGRKHHLGAQRLGRQPALSAPLGRRFRHTGFRHGRHAPRRTLVRPVRLHLLEPRRRRLRRPRRRRISIAAGCRSAC